MSTAPVLICPACDKPTRAYLELDPQRGPVRRCGNTGCNAGLPPERPAPAEPPRLALVKPAPSTSLPAPIAAAPTAAAGPIAWDDMAAQLRDRRAWILAKIAEARALQPELDRIETFLALDASPAPTALAAE